MFHSRCIPGNQLASTRKSRSCLGNTHHSGYSKSHTNLTASQQESEFNKSSGPSHSWSNNKRQTRTHVQATHAAIGDSSFSDLASDTTSDLVPSPENSGVSGFTTRRLASCGVVIAALVFNASQAAKALPVSPESPTASTSDSLYGLGEALSDTAPTASDIVRLEAESSAAVQLTALKSPTAGSPVSTAPVSIPTASIRSASTMLDLDPLSSQILAPPSPPPPSPGLTSPSVKRATGKYYVETRAPQVGCIFCKIAANSHKPGSPVIYQNDRMIVLPDIHPAAARHLLIIPRSHIANTECLEKEDKELLTEMLALGHSHLAKEQSTGVSPPGPVKIGYHQPPWRSVDHLHQHCFVLPHDPWWKVFKYAVPTVWIPATRLIQEHQ